MLTTTGLALIDCNLKRSRISTDRRAAVGNVGSSARELPSFLLIGYFVLSKSSFATMTAVMAFGQPE